MTFRSSTYQHGCQSCVDVLESRTVDEEHTRVYVCIYNICMYVPYGVCVCVHENEAAKHFN